MPETPLPEVCIGGVCERDIDLLLAQECAANPAFVAWLVEAAGYEVARGARLKRIGRSATTSNGESDLEILLVHPATEQRHLLLVENKIAAAFQPRQAERYGERGEEKVRTGECHTYRSVLLAPEAYLGEESLHGFDASVTYEQVTSWLAQAYEGAGRSAYVSRMFDAAIEKATHGWQLLEDATATEFWRRYWEASSKHAPELAMPKPKEKPSGSTFILFRPYRLPPGVYLLHKLSYGNVDLQFAGWGARVGEMSTRLAPFLERGMEVERAAKSAVVRCRVPVVDMHADVEESDVLLLEGIREAQRLYRWFERLPEDLREWLCRSA